MKTTLQRMFVLTFFVVMLSGCASRSELTSEYLDPLTAVTVTRNTAPLIFYRDNPSQAAYARDYLHVGPLRVNRSGTYRYYIWIGIWSTMQSGLAPAQLDRFESITFFVDGEPLLLDVVGWTPEAVGTSRPSYPKPVASAIDAYYAVSADQIRLIAAAADITVRTSGSPAREYQIWDSQLLGYKGLAALLE